MDDPIKIIWKYKNKNRRTQYNQYIYIGPVSSEVLKILNKISDLSLYDTWVSLSKSELKILEIKYGEFWYNNFFNTYHTNNTITLIRDTNAQKKEITDKFGSEWIKKHIEGRELIEKKILYSYEALFKDEMMRKTVKKGRTVASLDDNDIDIDYKTLKKDDISKIMTVRTKLSRPNNNTSEVSSLEELLNSTDDSDMQDQIGGNTTEIPESSGITSLEELLNLTDESDMLEQIGGNDDEPEEVVEEDQKDNANDSGDQDIFEEGVENDEVMSDDEEVDMQEIADMYKEVDANPDDNVKQTTSLIKKALDDDKLFEKKTSQMISFDTSKDTTIYDENLRDVFKKHYITTYYIFKDDTIKAIKDKISCSIKNNPVFEKVSYLSPSKIYLWGQYYYQGKIEKIMVGQKWVRRNELLNIDIEPNSNIRVYEELRGNLRTLRDNIKRYGNKIRRDDDDTNIYYDYENYIDNNEIFMLDVYNELGKDYKPDAESLKNLQEVYLKIYFPKIRSDDVKHIIEYLNGDTKIESDKISTIHDVISNDLIMDSEIMYMVEDAMLNKDYKKIFKENYITQSVIHVNLRLNMGKKVDLYRIFNEFIPTDQYPFIQYQTPDGQIAFSYKEDTINESLKIKNNADVLSKWFENSPYGISFKIKIKERGIEKFMAIGLTESGRIEYKTQWKEADMATIEDIKNTYNYVKDLVKKINIEKNKVQFDIPYDSEFKYAFINTIQKFELPGEYNINHNDLSEFARYFYPYIALVIEPRKRQAKVQKGTDKSKFGTYLRYKRVSKYDSQTRLEQRIMYFMRNYEYNDTLLGNEISKQFNITEDRAVEEIEKVRSRYPNLKKSRKILKKLENIPKYKPPGIGIDIQGKQRDKYKIRISGARDKAQLDRIITFMNILINLYTETYLLKIKDRQILKEKLKKLTNIAKRRSKVDDFVKHSTEINSVKQMAKLDKKRLGFKPEKGQNQWTRACQNSGNDKKRRPQQYNSLNMNDLIKKGYAYNKKSGVYERKITVKTKSGKEDTIIRTIKLPELDEEGNPSGNEIHYACSPDENGEHFYVGFLTRSNNPFGLPMPCCFKKDPMISKNKDKREFFLRSLGKMEKEEEATTQKSLGDKLYILQDTNKIQDGRFGFLPKYLDYFFNYSLDKEKKIKQHYLIQSKTGYFFKYGTKQDELQFLNALSATIDMSIDDIKNKCVKALDNDKSDVIFTSLNNGDIRTQFITRDKYIEYIKYNNYLDFDLINNLLSVPSVLLLGGLNILVFNKKIISIKKTLEKEKTKEDFILMCQNNEDFYSISDPSRQTIFMLKENKNYYPIVMAVKPDEESKTLDIEKTFKYQNKPDNIVNHIMPYQQKNCYGSFLDEVISKDLSLTSIEARKILDTIKDKDYNPKYQYIDNRNKCKFIITNNNLLVPVKPSGSLYDLQIVKFFDKYIDTYENTVNRLNQLYNKSNKQLPVKPIGVYYDNKSNNKIQVTAVMTITYEIVPVIQADIDVSKIVADGLTYENKPLYDKIDKELMKGKKNFVVDDRIKLVNQDIYNNESYELFRLEFSEFINLPNNAHNKKKLEGYIHDSKISKQQKIEKIRLFMYRLTDTSLYKLYKSSIDTGSNILDDIDGNEVVISSNQTGGVADKFVHIINKIPDVTDYKLNNNRSQCITHTSKDQCSNNMNCYWYQDECYFSLTKEMLISFVNRITDELVLNSLKAFEILKVGNYFVSDIVDYNRFKEREGQKTIKSTSNTIKKVLSELFGQDNAPKIGKRRGVKILETNYQDLNISNPLRDMKDYYSQRIIDNNMTIFRAYVNSYYWLKHPMYDNDSRNLGYYNPTQTDLSNYFKSLVIDWLQDAKNATMVNTELVKYMNPKRNSKNIVDEYIVKLGSTINSFTSCIVELYIINKIQDIPIIVYDDDNKIVYIFNNGIVYNHKTDKTIPKNMEKYTTVNKGNVINLQFSYISHVSIPDEINAIYYK